MDWLLDGILIAIVIAGVLMIAARFFSWYLHKD